MDGAHSAPSNMAVDEAIALHHNEGNSEFDATLRFYEWIKPTVSLGFGQPYNKAVDEQFCLSHGMEIVRRPTGGRAVLHHKEITYCFCGSYVSPFTASDINSTYTIISNAMVKGLKSCLALLVAMSPSRNHGLSPNSASPCFAASSNSEIISSDGAKAIGSAQRRFENAFLQHGSIPLEMDFELLMGSTRCGKEIESLIAPLSSLSDRKLTHSEVIEALTKGFEDYFGISFIKAPLTEKEEVLSETLRRTKYSNRGWNLNRRIGSDVT